MLPKQKPFYHPFQNASIGIWAEGDWPKNGPDGFVMDNIDMYYQPVQVPEVALTFSFIKLTIIIIGLFINIKLLISLKKENSTVNEVTTLFVWTQIIFYPVMLIFNTATDFIHPVDEIIGHWFCTLGWIIIEFCGYFTIFYSFIVAVMRHFFILHSSRVEEYGKEKAKKIFMFLMILFPFICVIWDATEELSILSYINKCYGNDHKVFLIETSTLDVLKHKFWNLTEHEKGGFLDSLFVVVRRISKLLKATVILVMGCNIFEAVIYYRVLSHLNG